MNRTITRKIGVFAAILMLIWGVPFLDVFSENPDALSFADDRTGKIVESDFEGNEPGRVPTGWSVAKTGTGEGSDWRVAVDGTAPAGPKVLAQTAESPGPVFNLCVLEDAAFKDLRASVAFKAVKGRIDQGGGIVWRYQDADNYYIARYNPLENNYRLYRVVNGHRQQLATSEGLSAPVHEWHTLAIEMKGKRITCRLNGQKLLEADDDTFTGAGKVGLWTKADARTYFDDFQAGAMTD